ncbi:MAG: 50S ribosomal protein L29 [Elusimicrobiota bacterium]|jgi:large subunit ribosomal protein L29|nr:50S ribosomal protein L29 [Elusimicrobiota bacterium]
MNGRYRLEFKNLSKGELETKLKELRGEIFTLKFRHAVSPLKNPIKIREIRKNIARVKTIISQQQSGKY